MTMDGDDMKRKTYTLAALALVIAGLGLGGLYYMENASDKQSVEQQVAEQETEMDASEIAVEDAAKEAKKPEETAKVSTVIPPKSAAKADTKKNVKKAADEQTAKNEEPTEEVAPTSATVEPVAAREIHFDTAAGLLWPVDGAVLMDYSMDQTTYFATLDQYKYNPAVIIAGNVNEKVKAAASGKITAINTNEVTGCTVTMDIGDGYSAIYGQLKEVPYEVGAYIEAGNTIGFVSEPTKYYSLEGSNVYFELQKDGAPTDPIAFFQ